MATAELTRAQPAACSSLAREMWRAWIRAYALLWAFTLGSCVLVLIVPDGPTFARGLLPLTLSAAHNPPPSIAGVLSIAANNTLRSVWPLTLGLIDAQRRRVTRLLADGAVLANLLVSGLLVGGAIGGHGTQVLTFLPHLPLEWAGLAIGVAGWLVERDDQPSSLKHTLLAALTIGVLLLAATTEIYMAPHTAGDTTRSPHRLHQHGAQRQERALTTTVLLYPHSAP